MKKETCLFYYQVVIYYRHRAERYCYGVRYRAYRLYKYILSRVTQDSLIEKVHFHVVCQRFDNSGSLYIGFGNSKVKAYKDSFTNYPL